MKGKIRKYALMIAGMFLVLGLSLPAFAAPVVYSGYDVGTSSLATSPNATNAAASFTAAVSTSVVTFESGIPAWMSVVNGVVTTDSGCSAAMCGYNTTPGGSNFLLRADPGTNYITINFTTPVYAFGAYFTGWQIDGQTLSYGSVTLDMPGGDSSYGGTLFFGFIDVGAAITSITYTRNSDIVAIDDVLLAGTTSAVPEPGTMLLLGIGIAGIAVARRKLRK